MAAKAPLEFTVVKLSPHGRWGGTDKIIEGVRLAEELGFDSINMPDHVILPQIPGQPPLPDVWYDNFVLASHLAALTKRIRFLFFILVIPYRHPVHVAKQLATLDVLSGGRVSLGAGIGWLKGEFEALGVPFHKRGAMTEEYIKAMKVLWTEERATFHGEFVDFTDVSFNPKCIQKPHIPIWIGGSAPLVIPRIVELGDGWLPWMAGPADEMRQHVRTIREQLKAAGRNPETFGFSAGVGIGEADTYSPHPSAAQDIGHRPVPATPVRRLGFEPQAVIEAIEKKRDDGFNHINISFGWKSPDELMRNMEWFAAKVMPSFKGVRAGAR